MFLSDQKITYLKTSVKVHFQDHFGQKFKMWFFKQFGKNIIIIFKIFVLGYAWLRLHVSLLKKQIEK
jgi:hypothetical protein